MNNTNQSWKCPSCDTLNTTRRCVICGDERPETKAEIKNTMQTSAGVSENTPALTKTSPNGSGKKTAEKKSNNGIIIALCAIIGVLIIAIIAVLIIFMQNKGEGQEQPQSRQETHTVEKGENNEEQDPDDESEEVEEDFIKDAVLGIRLLVSIDKAEIDKSPDYETAQNGVMEYYVPSGFDNVGNKKNEYRALDDTAHLIYSVSDLDDDATMKGSLDKKKAELKGSVKEERLYDDGYTIFALRNDAVYYVKAISNGKQMATLMFIYPKEYRSVYDGYIRDLSGGFKIESSEETEVIFEEENTQAGEETTE